MKISVRANTALFLAFSLASLHAQTAPPRVFLVDARTLFAERPHPDAVLLALAKKEGDDALRVKPASVMDKTATPPSGDKHDYMSQARYFWPNPATPNHLPYIRKDGETNPEIYGITDMQELERIGKATRSLALAWYLTGKEIYAEHATLLIRTWFINPATAMNPNANFTQYIPGVNTGRGAGILDLRRLTYVIDAVGMLADSKSWTPADEVAMGSWFSRYDTWLSTNAEAAHERAAPNNHGSWFAMQHAAIAMYLHNPEDARKIGKDVRDNRIPSQFDAKGMQKFEMVRTDSYSYSAFNIEALTQLSAIVGPLGVDLYKPAPGILTGLDALLPYDANSWPHPQIDKSKGKQQSLCPVLPRVAAHLHDPKLAAAEKRFDCEESAITRLESLVR